MPISRHDGATRHRDPHGESAPARLIMGSELRHEASTDPVSRLIGCLDAQAALK